MDRRTTTAAAILAVLGGVVLWQSWPGDGPGRPSGTFHVYVVGPTSLLSEGNVTLDAADPLRILLAHAAEADFTVGYDDLPGCAQDYVHAVHGHRETATGGWNFYLRADTPGASWAWQPRSASCPGALQAGDDVLWCWVEPDERCSLWPDP